MGNSHRALLRKLLIGGASLLLVALIGLAIYRVLVLPRGNTFDFFAIWFSIRRIWRGQNPYGLDTARAIQRHLFGRVLPPEEHQQGFAYPLYIALVLGPVALLPFPLAVTAWCTSQFCSLMAFPLLAVKAFHWSPSRRDLVGFSLAVLLVFRYPTIAFILGQVTIFVLICTLLGLYWFDRQRDVFAGAAFTLTLIKPNLGVLLVAAVVSWGILCRRWKVLMGVGGALALFLGFSFAWQPMWVKRFVAGVRLYTSYADVVWPFQQVGHVWIGGAILIAVGGLTAAAIVKAARSGNRRCVLLAFCFIVILSLTTLPQTGSYALTLLLIPAAGFLALAPQDRWIRAGVLSSLISPWLYWWLQTQHGIRIDQIALPLQFAFVGARILHTEHRWTGGTHSVSAACLDDCSAGS
jgi:hypothetical protein